MSAEPRDGGWRLVGVLTVTAGLLGVGATAGAERAAGTPVDPITEWSALASELAAKDGVSPLRLPLTLALLHLATHDAVASVRGTPRPYLAAVPVERPAAPEAAAVEAAFRVLVDELPRQRPGLEAARERALARLLEGPARTNGVTAGARAAAALLDRRAQDGRNADLSYAPRNRPGRWVPTPPAHRPVLAAFLARVTPFTLSSPSALRPAGPPAVGSDRYAADYQEVRRLGRSEGSARTPEQTAAARFWAPVAVTVWPATVRRLAAESRLDLAASARFQAAAAVAMADALIACWDAKYHFDSWRPVTAIRSGETDGDPRTEPEPDWTPLIETPDFPEYPSGHAAVTAAVTRVIEAYLPAVTRIPARNVDTGEERDYGRAEDVIREVVEARMLAGVHFRAADEDGATLGEAVARHVLARLPPR